MKIYLAEADVDSEEDRDKEFERKLDDLEKKVELTEAERNSLFDRVVELEDDLKGKVEEITKHLSEITRMKNENTILRQKLTRCESEIGETGKIKDKWLKSKRMLQELEEKQGMLKGKLCEALKNKEELEKQMKLVEKHQKKAENERDLLEKKIKEIEKQNASFEKQVNNLEDKRAEDVYVKAIENMWNDHLEWEWITCRWRLSPEIPTREDELQTIHILCPETPADQPDECFVTKREKWDSWRKRNSWLENQFVVSSKMINSMKTIGGDSEGVEIGVCSVCVGKTVIIPDRVVVSKVNEWHGRYVTHKCDKCGYQGDSTYPWRPSFWCDEWLNSASKGLWLEVELKNYVKLFPEDAGNDDVTIQVRINSKFVQDLMITGRSDKMLGKNVPMYSVVNINDTPEHTSLGNTSQCVSVPHHSGASIVGIKTKKVFEDGKLKPGASP